LIIVFVAPPKLTGEPEEQRIPLSDTLKMKIPISGKDPFTYVSINFTTNKQLYCLETRICANRSKIAQFN
jgi:hypothetical protein